MENTLNKWIDNLYMAVLGLGITWGGWYFAKSRKLKKTDEDSATVAVAKEMLQVIDLATSGFKDELSHVRTEFKLLQDKYVELSIQVGVLTRDNESKDRIIEAQKIEIKQLKYRIKELEHEV